MQYTNNELKTHSVKELKKIWGEIYLKPAHPDMRKDLLIRNLVYYQHTRENGDLSPKIKKQLYKLYEEFKQNPDFQPTGSKPNLKPGTRLVREWQGTVHTVTIAAKGYEYQGDSYKSLSAIARLITGSQWSGPAFFGLNQGVKA